MSQPSISEGIAPVRSVSTRRDSQARLSDVSVQRLIGAIRNMPPIEFEYHRHLPEPDFLDQQGHRMAYRDYMHTFIMGGTIRPLGGVTLTIRELQDDQQDLMIQIVHRGALAAVYWAIQQAFILLQGHGPRAGVIRATTMAATRRVEGNIRRIIESRLVDPGHVAAEPSTTTQPPASAVITIDD